MGDESEVAASGIPRPRRLVVAHRTLLVPGAGLVSKKIARPALTGKAVSYALLHPSRNLRVCPSSTSAQTLPPNPAPKAEAAVAPRFRADLWRKVVSST